jgi:hypothetical protein
MTIVRDFLQWLATAPANKRAEAAGARAGAYLCSDLTADELAPAEGLMLKLLDDPSPLVRHALADALAASPAAPAPVIIALAADQPQIAAPIYALSPLLMPISWTGLQPAARRCKPQLPAVPCCRPQSQPRSPNSAALRLVRSWPKMTAPRSRLYRSIA